MNIPSLNMNACEHILPHRSVNIKVKINKLKKKKKMEVEIYLEVKSHFVICKLCFILCSFILRQNEKEALMWRLVMNISPTPPLEKPKYLIAQK